MPRRVDKEWTGSKFVQRLLEKQGLVKNHYRLMQAPYSWEQLSNLRYLVVPVLNYDVIVFEEAFKLFTQLFRFQIPDSIELLSDVAAILHLPRNRHPGYPFEKRATTKALAIERFYSFLLLTMSPFWYGSLVSRSARKVEMRALEKFDQQKVRTVFMMCIAAVAVGVKYFYNLQESLKSCSPWMPYWCGRSRYNGGHHKLLSILRVFGIALDISGMDGSLTRVILSKIYSWKASKLKLSDAEYRKVFWYLEQILTGLLVDSSGRVYLKEHGNVSGQYCTTSDNTLSIILALIYVFLRNLIPVHKFLPLDGKQDYSFVCSGDDVLVSHDDVKCLHLNWIEPFAELGLKVRLTDVMTVDKCKFLGDRAIYLKDVGMWVPVPADMPKMYDAWAYHCKRESPLMNYIRTWNFHIMCYWDPDFRAVSQQALDLLKPVNDGKLHYDRVKLTDSVQYGDQVIRGDVVNSLFMTPDEILKLYTGWQAFGENSAKLKLNVEILAAACLLDPILRTFF